MRDPTDAPADQRTADVLLARARRQELLARARTHYAAALKAAGVSVTPVTLRLAHALYLRGYVAGQSMTRKAERRQASVRLWSDGYGGKQPAA